MRRLTARGVRVTRDGRDVLRGVDVEALAGQVLGVVGPSGSGKTTLLAVLAGMTTPDAGTVLLDGEPLTGSLVQRRRLGFLLQTHALLPALDAGENVEVGLRARAFDPGAAADRAQEALARVGLPDHRGRLVERLSGGQQQRVALARALAAGPELLLADEPTSELDATTRDLVVGVLREEAARGAAVVVATHDPEVADRCDVAVHLLDGHLVP